MSFGKKVSWAFFIMILCGGFIWGSEKYWVGKISISGINPEYMIIAQEKKTTCIKNPCLITLRPEKESLIRIEKEGFLPLEITRDISLWKEIEEEITLTKIPYITPFLGNYNKTSIFPISEEAKNTLLFDGSWEWRNQDLYENTTKKISFSRSGIAIASDELGRGVWGVSTDRLYFVDAQLAQKQVVYRGDIAFFRTFGDGSVGVGDGKSVFRLFWDGKSLRKEQIPALLGLKSVCKASLSRFLIVESGALWTWSSGEEKQLLQNLENFNAKDFDRVECIAPYKALLFFGNKKFLLEF